MIILTDKVAIFKPESGMFTQEREFPLLYGHICPHCEMPIHALVELPDKGPMTEISLFTYARSTKVYSETPVYDTKLVKAGGKRAFWLVEKFHMSQYNLREAYDIQNHTNRCKYWKGILETDRKRRALRALKNLFSVSKHEPEFTEAFYKEIQKFDHSLEVVDQYLLQNTPVVPSTTGKGPDLMLLAFVDWNKFHVDLLMQSVRNTLGLTAETSKTELTVS